jgi:hypothetical protein
MLGKGKDVTYKSLLHSSLDMLIFLIRYAIRFIQGDPKNGNFWKIQKKLKKSNKKKLLTEIEPLTLWRRRFLKIFEHPVFKMW